jgi:hypothetical protein
MGYPTLADEHEAKYGPGMFQQIDQLMKELEEGIGDQSKEEKEMYVERLNYFREEMADCRDIHPKERKNLLEELDTAILALMTGEKIERRGHSSLDDDSYTEDTEAEYNEVEEEELQEEYDDEDDEAYDDDEFEDIEELDEEFDLDEEDEDFDVEEELGLDLDDDDEGNDEDIKGDESFA